MHRYPHHASRLLLLLAFPAHAQEFINLNSPGAAYTVHGQEPGDQLGAGFGTSLGAGDLNGDGIADLVLGASAADGPTGTLPQGGEVHVVFGPLRLRHVRDFAVEPCGVTIYGRGAIARTFGDRRSTGTGSGATLPGHRLRINEERP